MSREQVVRRVANLQKGSQTQDGGQTGARERDSLAGAGGHGRRGGRGLDGAGAVGLGGGGVVSAVE